MVTHLSNNLAHCWRPQCHYQEAKWRSQWELWHRSMPTRRPRLLADVLYVSAHWHSPVVVIWCSWLHVQMSALVSCAQCMHGVKVGVFRLPLWHRATHNSVTITAMAVWQCQFLSWTCRRELLLSWLGFEIVIRYSPWFNQQVTYLTPKSPTNWLAEKTV